MTHTKRTLAIALAALVAGGLIYAKRNHTSYDRVASLTLLPSTTLHPGVPNPKVTQGNVRTTVCKKGWTSTVRPPTSYTSPLKTKMLRDERLAGVPSDYELDHKIALEDGGDPQDIRNLWMQPLKEAKRDDQLENTVNRMICSGQVTLAVGQQVINEYKNGHG